MPIKPENKERYPKDWPEIRARILQRAENRCERCGVLNYARVRRVATAPWCWVAVGSGLERRFLQRGMELRKPVKVVLTIGHVHDPSPENCEESNLAAWCQRCHNVHDSEHRKRNAAQTRRRKADEGTGQCRMAL